MRYGDSVSLRDAPRAQARVHRRPVVVWNTTRRCNLHCVHCYASAQDVEFEGELTTQEGKALIDDLASYGVPVLLFSGGEPLMRHDLFEMVAYASSKGLRAVLSTNGTLITPEAAAKLKAAGTHYVGVSIDGVEATNDRFRGKKGAFRMALQGLRNARAAGLKTGLRFTLTRYNVGDLEAILDMAEKETARLCIYHLVYAGRAAKQAQRVDLTASEAREAMNLLFQKAQAYHDGGLPMEVLTVDNHADGPYLYLHAREHQPERADEILALLKRNGGNSSGVGIGAVSSLGDVHPDQFWRHYSPGNVRQRPFSQIWEDTSDPVMAGLKDRRARLTGRCASCRFLDVCNGNFRVRAEAVYGDLWAPDPACYLTDDEVGVPSAAKSWSI
ncbi:MAG: radical SAM protein [Chloroflexota bacterium]|nr:radical SAM protein [Chloroflexota bacterium]